jgi:hypothetical protein
MKGWLNNASKGNFPEYPTPPPLLCINLCTRACSQIFIRKFRTIFPGRLVRLDEIEANRLVSAVAVSILIVTALFIFSVDHTEVSISVSKSGWIVDSSGGNTSASLGHTNCSYQISNNPDTNSTTVAGVVQEAFMAFQGSSNLTYGMEFSFWFSYLPQNFIIDVHANATLISVMSVQIYNYSFYVTGGAWALGFRPPTNPQSFNNSNPEEYRFVMDWASTITFINPSLSDAQFFCNISFSYTFPDLIAVNLPSSLGYATLVVAVIGVVVISMVFKAWNRPRVVDDSVG